MLILGRREGDSILIEGGIRIVVVSCDRGGVRIGIEAPPELKILRGEIAQQVATDRHASLTEASAAFSALDLALADTTIAMYDAKYTDHVWRPVTAIQATDPTWNPLTPTAADPSYPGAHSALSAAAATALTAFYGSPQAVTVTSAADPGVSRQFASLTDAADEAELDDIYETERRLLYVACTRAREHLLLIGIRPASEYLEDFDPTGTRSVRERERER